MATSKFVRLFRRIMGQALSPYGFHQRKGSRFWRERNRLLHHIGLERSSFDGAFTVSSGVQPLFDPFDAFSWSLGGRLIHFGLGEWEWREPAEDRKELEATLRQLAALIVERVVPWLDRFQTSRDIVEAELSDNWEIFGSVDTPGWHWRVALCALDAEMHEVAAERLQRVVQYWTRRTPQAEWDKKQLQRAQELLALLKQGNREGIRSRLAEYEAYTRAALGIDLPSAEGVNIPSFSTSL